jgi:predicted nucleic acid-binding Zn finger protein
MATPRLKTTIQERAKAIPADMFRVNEDKQSAVAYGSRGAYDVTLTSCSCPDFQQSRQYRGEVCKHIQKLKDWV